MSYILPIPNYQYSDYRERVLNETKARDRYVDPAEKPTFDQLLNVQNDSSSGLEERREKRHQADYEAFRIQLAKTSGKGVQIDQWA